jgi:hypothetical protein
MDMTGSVVWDGLYDFTYAHWQRSADVSPRTWLVKTPGRLLEELRRRWKRLSDGRTDE